MAEWWSGSDRGYRIRLTVDPVPNSINVSNNTSRVRYTLTLFNTSITFSGYSCSGWINYNGTVIPYSGSPAMLSWNTSVVLIDTERTITHNSDGNYQTGTAAYFTGSGGYSPGALSIDVQYLNLPTIQRASTFTVPNITIGKPVKININSKNSSFRHTIRYGFGKNSGTIQTNVGGGEYTWFTPTYLANSIPTSNSGLGTIWVDTYNNGTLIGTTAQIPTFSLNPETFKPNLSDFTLSDTNATAASIGGVTTYVQNKSGITLTYGATTTQFESVITEYSSEIVGTAKKSTENPAFFNDVFFNGSYQIRARVKDSRGNWSDYVTKSITVLPYTTPSLNMTVERAGANLTNCVVRTTASVSPLTIDGVQKNKLTISYKYAVIGSSNYTNNTSGANMTLTETSIIPAQNFTLSGSFNTGTSYTVIATLTDIFGLPITDTEILPTEVVPFQYDKTGVGVGKYRERGFLDVAGEIYAFNKPIQHHRLTNHSGTAFSYASGTADLNTNTFATCGYWGVNEPANGPTVDTTPNQFFITGIFESVAYGTQIAVQKNRGDMFIRNRFASTWTPWVKVATSNQNASLFVNWTGTGVSGVSAKRQGDRITVKYDVTGNGGTMFLGTIPTSVLAGATLYAKMESVPCWEVSTANDRHIQINIDGTMYILESVSGKSYRGSFDVTV